LGEDSPASVFRQNHALILVTENWLFPAGRRQVHLSTMENKLLKIGIVGTIIAAICCFTPALVILLGAVGLSAWLGWLDIVLLPALAIFLVITGYALWKRSRPA